MAEFAYAFPPDLRLATAEDLAAFKGAPFSPPVIEGAAESVRDECGWHIAPNVTSSVRMRGGGTVLLLPTLRLTGVGLIKTSDGTVITGWDWLPNGVVERPGGFPRIVEVHFTHGYDKCPASLLGVIAERASSGSYGRVRQESLGGRSVSLESGYDTVGGSVVQKYTLPKRP